MLKTIKYITIICLLVFSAQFPILLLIVFLLASYDTDKYNKKFNQRYINSDLDNVPKITWANKKAYLRSHKWQIKRKQVLYRDNYTCQSCKCDGLPLEVHHITYANKENEKLSELVSLCRGCHQAIHDRYGYNYDTEYPIK